MRVLLDTHTFLWWVMDSPRLSTQSRQIITDGNNAIFLSAVSGWEMAIKAQYGRLQLPKTPDLFVAEQLALNAFQSLPVQMSHALHVYTLPQHHRDPFDRLLIAQSQLEDMPLLSADSEIGAYNVHVIW